MVMFKGVYFMKISTNYNLNKLTYEIYVSGCRGSCHNCHNIELKDYNFGKPLDLDELHNTISKLIEEGMLTAIWLLGGEPLDRDIEEILPLLISLQSFDVDIFLFTRYSIGCIPLEIQMLLDYIKCGSYINYLPPKTVMDIKLGSANQYIAYGERRRC